MSDGAADLVSISVHELHDAWLEKTGQPIAEPRRHADDGDNHAAVPAPQCGELYGPRICGEQLTGQERLIHAVYVRQLSQLVLVPQRDGPANLPFPELFHIVPSSPAADGSHQEVVVLMITRYVTPRFPIFLLCDAPDGVEVDTLVSLRPSLCVLCNKVSSSI